MANEIMSGSRNVSGGSLPDGAKFAIHITIDYTDTSRDELIARAFAADVIKLQTGLRKKTINELEELGRTGLSLTGNEVGIKGTKTVNIPAALKALGYTDEQVKMITENKEMAMKLFDDMSK